MTPSMAPPVPPEIRRQQQQGPPPQSMLSAVAAQQQGAQQSSGVQALSQAISKLADATGEVAKLAQMAAPQLQPYIEKFIQIGKVVQEEVGKMAQNQAGAPSGPPPPTNPAETPIPGMAQ